MDQKLLNFGRRASTLHCTALQAVSKTLHLKAGRVDAAAAFRKVLWGNDFISKNAKNDRVGVNDVNPVCKP